MLNQESVSELELRDYLAVLRHRKLFVLITVALVVGASLLYSYVQEPVYAATSRLLLQPKQSESPFDANTGARVDPARALLTAIEVLKSQMVETEVRRKLGSAPGVSASPVGQTDVVRVTVMSTDPKRAAAAANAYAQAYIDVVRQQAVDGLLAAGAEIQDKIDGFQEQIRQLDSQVSSTAGPDQNVVRESLSGQRQALLQQQALFKQTLDQLTVDANLASGGAQLVGNAAVPTVPVSPKPVRNAILAIVVGLMLGVGLAFLVEYLDDSIKTREDLERLTSPIPVIAQIPAVLGWRERDQVQLVSVSAPSSPAAEAYRTLRTAIQFVALDHPMGVVQVTSSNASEGKTTTLVNLGVALAKAGQRVILVCCDLRRPRLHEFLGLSNEVGFTSLLLGNAPLSRTLQQVPGVPRLRLLASGPLPPNPSELLSSGRTKEVFAALKGEADIVLIDSPPVLPVTDALVLFRQVDATLMVFAAGQTTQKQAATALAMANQVNAPLVGTILNGVSTPGGYNNQYTYGYTSIAEDEARERMKKLPRRDARKPSRRDQRKPPRRAPSSNGVKQQPLKPAERKPNGAAPAAKTPDRRP